MIKITTDSTCDLPQWILDKYDISVCPLGVAKGGVLFQDGIDITTGDIQAHVEAGGDITTTSAVNIGQYADFFMQQLQGHTGLIHLNVGMGFSSCHQNARLAATEMEQVHVVDSANLSVGHGMQVLAAAEAAKAGASAKDILAMLAELCPRVEANFVLDTLDYMKKGGRCSAVTALGANLLKLHPCIEVVDGKMGVTKKYRGSMEKVVGAYVKERVGNRDDIDRKRVFLVDTCQNQALVDLTRAALVEHGGFEEIIECKAGCTIFCHCGPDTVAVMFARN